MRASSMQKVVKTTEKLMKMTMGHPAIEKANAEERLTW